MTPIEASEMFGTAGAELPRRFTTRGVDPRRHASDPLPVAAVAAAPGV